MAYADGQIVAIGTWPEVSEAFPSSAVLGSGRDVIIPGLVNSHHHVGLTPFQLGAPDLPLELWSLARNGVPKVDPYLDTLVSAFEMIQSGVTTVHHIQGRLGVTSNWEHHVQEVLRAYHDVGMRVTYSVGFRDQSFFVQGKDDEFLAKLPRELAIRAIDSTRDTSLPIVEHLKRFFVELYESHGRNESPKVRIQLAPLNLHWCSDSSLELIRDMSEKYDVGIHMHLLETNFQKTYAQRRTGVSAVEHLDHLGILSPRFTLGHGVWLTEADISILSKRDVVVCHNPSSNLRLRSGIAPIKTMLEHGLAVALGIDEAGLNDDRDMFQEMRLALNLHRVPGLTSDVPTALDVWQMATTNGARSAGYSNQIGVLKVGAMADFSMISASSIAGAYLDPSVSVLDSIVRRGKPIDMAAVVIAGDVVFEHGRFTGVDRETVFRELSERMTNGDESDLQRRRALSAELEPYVRHFYDGWEESQTNVPFYGMNSRL
jgi:cytosine/adenosine deaminase-related metal-dependent hydrolase